MNNRETINTEKLKLRLGFTLIELMLVVVIVGILAAMVVPHLGGRSEEARNAAARADIEANLSLALDLYEMDNGAYPKGLNGLIAKPGDVRNWKGPYIKRVPIDPWGNEYTYQSPGVNNPTSYDLSSKGRDNQSGTQDDIANW